MKNVANSRFDEYQSVNLYLPARVIQAMDRIASRLQGQNRSKIATVVLQQDFEIQAEILRMEDEENGTNE